MFLNVFDLVEFYLGGPDHIRYFIFSGSQQRLSQRVVFYPCLSAHLAIFWFKFVGY